jgi:hypothetical protein
LLPLHRQLSPSPAGRWGNNLNRPGCNYLTGDIRARRVANRTFRLWELVLADNAEAEFIDAATSQPVLLELPNACILW